MQWEYPQQQHEPIRISFHQNVIHPEPIYLSIYLSCSLSVAILDPQVPKSPQKRQKEKTSHPSLTVRELPRTTPSHQQAHTQVFLASNPPQPIANIQNRSLYVGYQRYNDLAI